jgi:transcriptional antiterminator Rof (Rho-off)
MSKYVPVSCDLYDQLSNASVLNENVQLDLVDKNIVYGKVSDIYTKDHEEFVVIDKAQHIRLDLIARITSL